MSEKIIDVIKSVLNTNEEINIETDLKELNIDSLVITEICMCLEDEFEVEIPAEDIPQMTSIPEIEKIISKYVKE